VDQAPRFSIEYSLGTEAFQFLMLFILYQRAVVPGLSSLGGQGRTLAIYYANMKDVHFG
jgi:hypothetical protein